MNKLKTQPETIELIASICHNVNKAYCEGQNDFSHVPWEEAPDWQKESALDGVRYHLENDLTPEESHEAWLEYKLSEGWVYGKDKDPEKKTHPCMMRYSELPKYQRTKDVLFKSVVDSFKDAWGK